MLKQVSETMQEIGRYMGTVMLYYFKDVIEGALTLLIVVRDITKSLAQGFDSDIAIGGRDDVFGGLASSADNASDSIDELNGKLLSFDKFTALSTSESDMTSDVEKILASLGDYTSGFENVANSARETADAILDWLGYTTQLNPETGEIMLNLKEGYQNIELIRDAIIAISGLGLINLLTHSSMLLFTIFTTTRGLGMVLNGIVIVGILSLFKLMTGLNDSSKIIYGITLSFVGLATAIMTLKAVISGGSFLAWLPMILAGVGAFAVGIYGIIDGIKGSVNDGISTFSGFFAKGGFPTKGSLFVANEAGAELVGNIGGRTAVANNDMIIQGIENASYRGMVRAMSTQNGNKDIIAFDFSTANDSKIARALVTPMIDELKRQGYKVEKV